MHFNTTILDEFKKSHSQYLQKWLAMNSTKKVKDLYNENYKNLIKENIQNSKKVRPLTFMD
jgi:hypothetical protein